MFIGPHENYCHSETAKPLRNLLLAGSCTTVGHDLYFFSASAPAAAAPAPEGLSDFVIFP